jgi:hypothetical protein
MIRKIANPRICGRTSQQTLPNWPGRHAKFEKRIMVTKAMATKKAPEGGF